GNQNAQQQLQQLTQNALNNILNKPSSAIFAGIFDKAEKTTRTAKQLLNLLGGKEASKTGSSFDFLLDLSEKVQDTKGAEKIITLGNQLSSTIQFAHIKKQKAKHGDELAGYSLTKNPAQALPRELALPDELFYYKFLSSGFLAREKLSVVEGAYYVLLDKSGSMDEHNKTVWSRSVALALFKLARARKRDFYLQFFDTDVYPDLPYTKPQEILKALLQVQSSGGTKIDDALEVAIQLLKTKYANKANSIILITDGEDEVATTKTQLSNVQLISVMIEGHNPTLQSLSSQFLKVAPDEKGALRILEVAER
ncbi:MAG: vWA domain-containing protein, partial [Thermoproteota archaeon]